MREHAYQAYVCRLTPPDDGEATLEQWNSRRNRLMQRLYSVGVATRPGTHAPHMLGYYRNKYGIRAADYPNSWRADWLTLAIPLYAHMTTSDQEYVCASLADSWSQKE